MSRKVFSYWNTALLLLAFTQCSQCEIAPLESIAHWELTWEEAEPFGQPFPEVNLQEGISCYVDSEKATYYLNPTGECWRFTQNETQGLTYQEIASFPGVTDQQSFSVFSAGSIQKQTLHVCLIDGKQVILTHYEGGKWMPIGRYELPTEQSGAPVAGAACSIYKEKNRPSNEERYQINGLIVFRPQPEGDPLIILEYNPDTKELTPSDTWNGQYNLTPDAAAEIAPNMVLLGAANPQQSTMVDCLTKGDSIKSSLSKLEGESKRLDLFVLKARGWMKKAVLALYTEEEEKTNLDFYTLEIGENTRSMELVPNPSEQLEISEQDEEEEQKQKRIDNIDHGGSLLIPFPDAVYVIAQLDSGPVYYKGSLKEPIEQIEGDASDINDREVDN